MEICLQSRIILDFDEQIIDSGEITQIKRFVNRRSVVADEDVNKNID